MPNQISFHLADNAQDPDYPFAFMATLAESTDADGHITYQPLGRVVTTYQQSAPQRLHHLLRPIRQAATTCPWVHRLLVSQNIYHPMVWTTQEAYDFLQNVPELERCGLTVRVPDWWKKRARARVQINIGKEKTTHFNAQSLIDFSVEVALNGESLNSKEVRILLDSTDKLVFLRDQWVEVDSQQLTHTLTRWQSIETTVNKTGLSLAKAINLLLNSSTQRHHNSTTESPAQETWVDIQAGDGLKALLKTLRDPSTIPTKRIGENLHATLRPYQTIGVTWLDFLSERGIGACLADDMGLGKTIQVIALLLLKKAQRKTLPPSLLILPAALLANWKAELARFAPSLSVVVLHPSEMHPDAIKTVMTTPADRLNADLLITTYGIAWRQPWLQAQTWHLIILDEAQVIKNPGSKQTRQIKRLKGSARIALTGTPIENQLADLWSLFDFVSPGLLGSRRRFKMFLADLAITESHNLQPIKQVVQPYILRRLKTDKTIIPHLPDKIEMTVWCSLSKLQLALYERAVKELKNSLENTVDKMERRGVILAHLIRFKQICNHPAQALGNTDYISRHSGKFSQLATLCRAIAQHNEKVLVFTQFREFVDPLHDHLADVFGRSGLRLHGGTATDKRRSLINQFERNDGPPFFILPIKADGVGLNLTAATHVVHFDRSWNLAIENQMTNHAFRIGQQHNVVVHKFACRGTIEEKMDHLIQDRSGSPADVLDDAEPLLTELDDDTLLRLVSLDIHRVKY